MELSVDCMRIDILRSYQFQLQGGLGYYIFDPQTVAKEKLLSNRDTYIIYIETNQQGGTTRYGGIDCWIT